MMCEPTICSFSSTNMTGITDIMNTTNIQQGVSLIDAEKSIIGLDDTTPTADPAEAFTKMLKQIITNYDIGINVDLSETPLRQSPSLKRDPSPPLQRVQMPPLQHVQSLQCVQSPPLRHAQPPLQPVTAEPLSTLPPIEVTKLSFDPPEAAPSECSDTLDATIATQNQDMRQAEERRNILAPVPPPPLSDPQREQIDIIMKNICSSTHTPHEQEHKENIENKASKLNTIDELRRLLEEEGVDCTSIEKPHLDTSLEHINQILRVLRDKNERNRHSTFADEMIMCVAETIETAFDGKRAIFGIRPDYTGFSNTIRVKTQRIRPETAQVVNNLFNKKEMNPLIRILGELCMSLLLYPIQRNKQKRVEGLHASFSRSSASSLSSIRRAEVSENLLN